MKNHTVLVCAYLYSLNMGVHPLTPGWGMCYQPRAEADNTYPPLIIVDLTRNLSQFWDFQLSVERHQTITLVLILVLLRLEISCVV